MIGARLRLTRQAFELEQKDFAATAGIAQNTYNQYEQGKRVPNLEMAYLICRHYNITLDWIYRGIPSGLPLNVMNLLRRRASEMLTSVDMSSEQGVAMHTAISKITSCDN